MSTLYPESLDSFYTVTADTQIALGIWGTYSASSPDSYQWIRIKDTHGSASCLVIGEIEFYGDIDWPT